MRVDEESSPRDPPGPPPGSRNGWSGWYPIAKRVFDILLSLFGLGLSLPVWLIVSASVAVETGWPILFSQQRVGRGGRSFDSLKFRSMRQDAEAGVGPVQAAPQDDRVTPFGRVLRSLALDELPQLLNILKGEMSFVGPRALRPMEIEAGDDRARNVSEYEGFEERCTVEPGLTGVAQLLLPRDISREVKFRYDLWYVRNCTFLLDLHLIVMSLVISARGHWETSGRTMALIEPLRARVTWDLERQFGRDKPKRPVRKAAGTKVG